MCYNLAIQKPKHSLITYNRSDLNLWLQREVWYARNFDLGVPGR